MPPAVWLAYTPDRKGIHPQTALSRRLPSSRRSVLPGGPSFLIKVRVAARPVPQQLNTMPETAGRALPT
jgi:hypothetical protein